MNGVLALLPMLAIVAATAFAVWQLLAGLRSRGPVLAAVLTLSIAFPLGGGVVSLLHYALMPVGVQHPSASGAILLALVSVCWIMRGRWKDGDGATSPDDVDQHPPFPHGWVLGLVAIGALMAMLGSVLMRMGESPHGNWDSWAIWTVKAKYLASGEPYWRNAMDATYRFMHPEYPLLTPSLIAWCWKWGDSWHMIVPQAVALLSLLSLAGLSFSTVALLRGTTQGFLALLSVSAPIMLVANGAALYADIPMAAMLTASAAMVALSLEVGSGAAGGSRQVPTSALAGLLAGLCAWMKVEGLLHLGALFAGLMLVTVWTGLRKPAALSRLAGFVGGLLPVGLFLVWFRSGLPALDLPAIASGGDQGRGLLSLVLDPGRYVDLVTTGAQMLREMGPLWAHPFAFLALAIAFLSVRRERKRLVAPLALLAAWALIWAGYLSVYIVGIHSVVSYMRNSFDRLLMHPWPLLVIIVFLATKTIEEWAIPSVGKGTRRDRKRSRESVENVPRAKPKSGKRRAAD